MISFKIKIMKLNQLFQVILLTSGLVLISCVNKKINHPPTVNNQEFSVQENSSSGSPVGQILAVDEDNDTLLTYSITHGNLNNAFDISPTNGKITVHNEDALDFETTPVFILYVEVKDSQNKSTTARITINLENVDPPTTGLLLYYPFDGTMSDISGNNNNGIDFTSDNYVAGKWSQGLDFNGTSDYIRLTNTISGANGLSFSFWVNSRGANGIQNNGAIVSKYNMSTNARCFMVSSFGSGTARNDNRLSAAFYNSGYSASYADFTKSYLEAAELTVYPDPSKWTIVNPIRLETGTWTHCIVNMTPSDIEIWLNGVMCTKKHREFSTYFDSAGEAVYIGNNIAGGDGSNNHFNGILDELRIYTRYLTSDEIKTLFKEK